MCWQLPILIVVHLRLFESFASFQQHPPYFRIKPCTYADCCCFRSSNCCPAESPWRHPPAPHKSYKGFLFPYSSPRSSYSPIIYGHQNCAFFQSLQKFLKNFSECRFVALRIYCNRKGRICLFFTMQAKNKRYLATQTKYRSFCCLGILFGSYPMFSTLETVILEANRTASSLLLWFVPGNESSVVLRAANQNVYDCRWQSYHNDHPMV